MALLGSDHNCNAAQGYQSQHALAKYVSTDAEIQGSWNWEPFAQSSGRRAASAHRQFSATPVRNLQGCRNQLQGARLYRAPSVWQSGSAWAGNTFGRLQGGRDIFVIGSWAQNAGESDISRTGNVLNWLPVQITRVQQEWCVVGGKVQQNRVGCFLDSE